MSLGLGFDRLADRVQDRGEFARCRDLAEQLYACQDLKLTRFYLITGQDTLRASKFAPY